MLKTQEYYIWVGSEGNRNLPFIANFLWKAFLGDKIP